MAEQPLDTPRCRDCEMPAVWVVKSRVPSTQTSRLGCKSWQGNACEQHLRDSIQTALVAVSYTAPVKVSFVGGRT